MHSYSTLFFTVPVISLIIQHGLTLLKRNPIKFDKAFYH